MKLVMTLLVKDEADIVAANLDFHLALGVDALVVTDNGSTDGTREIIEEYASRTECIVVDEPGDDYSQSRWVTRMAELARDELGADWILNNDADELWLPEGGTLRSALSATLASTPDANLVMCHRYNMVCAHDAPETGEWSDRLRYRIARPIPRPRLEDPLRDAFEAPYYYWALPGKALCRAEGLRSVSQGNHGASYENRVRATSESIRVYHFPYRSRAQFLRKVTVGGAAYARNRELPPTSGWHWRRWHRMAAEVGVDAIPAEVLPSAEQLQRDLAQGTVVEDLAIHRRLLGEM